MILISAIVFVCAWYITVRIASPWHTVKTIEIESVKSGITTSAEAFDTLRVGCYNIAHCRGGQLGADNWDGGDHEAKLERTKQIGQLLKEVNLDIVVLNEADFSSFWSGHVDQARIIAKEAGYRYVVEQRNIDVAIPFVSLRFGNAILSKFPLSEAKFLDYPHPSRLQEIFVGGYKDGLAVTVTMPNGEQVQVIAVHLSLEGETYQYASVQMFMDMQTQSSLPMIAMGDFNSTAKGYPGHHTNANGQNCIDTLLDSGNWSTQPRGFPVNPEDYTFPSKNPTRVIDWIFISPHWRIEETIVLTSDLSDHLPVVATLKRDYSVQ